MDGTAFDAYKYIYVSVLLFGILGNALVITSILRRRNLLENNYYYLVLHLAVSDLGYLVVVFVYFINFHFADPPFFNHPRSACLFLNMTFFFQVAGVYMMLIISLLRCHAAVHPLKHAIVRRDLKVVCGLGYALGLIAGFGAASPLCIIPHTYVAKTIYQRSHYVYAILFFYFVPTTFMAVSYYKAYGALMKQNRYLKSLRLDPETRINCSSSFLRYIRKRRTLLVCLSTVLCYGVANLPMSVFLFLDIAGAEHPLIKYSWVMYLADILRVAGSCSVNPLIYGILDKTLLPFWKLCPTTSRGEHENEELL